MRARGLGGGIDPVPAPAAGRPVLEVSTAMQQRGSKANLPCDYRRPSGSEHAPLGAVASWQVDARIYGHLFVAVSGPLPGSEADIGPQLAEIRRREGFTRIAEGLSEILVSVSGADRNRRDRRQV